MFEFHGWFCIQDSTIESDFEQLRYGIGKIRSYLDQQNWGTALVDLRSLNGNSYLTLCGCTNRPTNHFELFDGLFKCFQEYAPGTYGLLYWHHHGDPNPPGINYFKVNVVAKGKVTQHLDPFLSPIVPTIEDLEEGYSV